MAVIYSYPVKSTPANNDLILISDSADSNNTKQVTVASITSQTAGVTSIIAGTNVTISSTGASGTGNVTINAGPGTGTQYNLPIWSTTSTLGDSLITQNAGATVLNVGTNIASFSTVAGVGSVFATQVSVNGYSTFGGKLKLGSPDGATHVIIEGPANGGAAYTLKLPSSAPGNNQILQYTTSGNLGWINTPTGSGGISFSGSTANGIATYFNSTTATVSSVFTISGNKLSAPAGTLADPSIEVGAVGGLYAASGAITLAHTGADAIGVSSASIINYKLTQFNSGLKFGSTGSTLSTYTEATWTSGPTLTFSVGGTATLSASAGSYRVIGDMVFAQFEFTFSSGGYGTAELSLPVSGIAGTGSINFVKMNSNVGNSTVSTPVTGNINLNSASIRLKSFNYDQDSASHVSGQLFELVDTSGQPIFQNGDIVSGTIIYRKA